MRLICWSLGSFWKERYYPRAMKNTGMNRKVDDLGRIVLPAELRKTFGLQEGDLLDISVEENRIILIPRQDFCVFCRSTADLKEFKERMVCAICMTDLSSGSDTAPNWDPFAQA